MNSMNAPQESQTPIEHLARRARAQDSAALDELLRVSRPGLLRHASRLVRDTDAAQDVVQETLMRLHASIGQLQEPAAFWVWAKTILQREAFDHFHKEKRYVHDSVDSMESASEPEIDQHGEAVLLEEEMDRYLRQMRNDDRNLLGLFYWREFEVTEIAEILGVAVGAVKVRLFRARNRLRELLVESERELFSH